jgi:hypothetical protein
MNSRSYIVFLSFFIFDIPTSSGIAAQKHGSFHSCESSRAAFSTVCPNGWNRLGSEDSIDIINFPLSQREEGVVIKDGGAEIVINKHDLNGEVLSDWINRDNFGTHVLKRASGGRTLLNRRCSHIEYVEVSVDQGSPSAEVDSQIYCQFAKGIFKFELRFWANDRRRQVYESVLSKMFVNFKFR